MSGEIVLDVVDMHAAGEPVRIVVGGYPELPGATILEKRRAARERHDHLRRALMLEPRGHADMYGVIPVAPSRPDAAFAALFMHCEGYSTMCGHATIALGKWLVESGRVRLDPADPSFGLELPCGLVRVTCALEGARVASASFVSTPAFLAARDVALDVPGLGRVVLDLAYGGAFYAVLASSAIGLDFFATPVERLRAAAIAITEAGRARLSIRHPDEPDLGFLYGTILTDDAPPPADTYNLCVFADGQIDRSPTGSGATARMARDAARGLVGAGATRAFRGASGLPFHARIVGPAEGGPPGAVLVRVGGTSAYVGTARFTVDPDDPLGLGFAPPARFADLTRPGEPA